VGGPPIYLAGTGGPAVRRAAPIWRCVADRERVLDPGDHTANAHHRATLKEYGQPPAEFPIAQECYVWSSRALAYRECKAALEYKYAAHAASGMTSPLERTDFDDFARDRFIIGDKASMKAQIIRYTEPLGVDHFIMRIQWPGFDQDEARSGGCTRSSRRCNRSE
jgi:hypothetical protein